MAIELTGIQLGLDIVAPIAILWAVHSFNQENRREKEKEVKRLDEENKKKILEAVSEEVIKLNKYIFSLDGIRSGNREASPTIIVGIEDGLINLEVKAMLLSNENINKHISESRKKLKKAVQKSKGQLDMYMLTLMILNYEVLTEIGQNKNSVNNYLKNNFGLNSQEAREKFEEFDENLK